jgi:ketosteroid isomerase-like protein
VELVREAAAAINRWDVPAFLASLDADIELEWGPGFMVWGDTYRGHAGIERFLRGFRQFREFRFRVEEPVDHGPYVVAVIAAEGRGAASGVPVTSRAGGSFEIRNGKVVRMAAYRDKAEALEAVGLSE